MQISECKMQNGEFECGCAAVSVPAAAQGKARKRHEPQDRNGGFRHIYMHQVQNIAFGIPFKGVTFQQPGHLDRVIGEIGSWELLKTRNESTNWTLASRRRAEF